jgi:Hemerythrin HHE cation binding domain
MTHMDTSSGTQPAVTGFVLGQLRRLSDEAAGLERMANDRGSPAAIAEAIDRLRRRLGAHVIVEERFFTPNLRDSDGYRSLLALENAHDALGTAPPRSSWGAAPRWRWWLSVAPFARTSRRRDGSSSRRTSLECGRRGRRSAGRRSTPCPSGRSAVLGTFRFGERGGIDSLGKALWQTGEGAHLVRHGV